MSGVQTSNEQIEGEALASDGPVAVSKDGDYATPTGATPDKAGTYYWVATYTGDANNKPATSGCAAEPITVGQAAPSLETTQQPAAATVGANFKDRNTTPLHFSHPPISSTVFCLYTNKTC